MIIGDIGFTNLTATGRILWNGMYSVLCAFLIQNLL